MNTIELRCDVEALDAAAQEGDGGAKVPRFRMVAYTGEAMRVEEWDDPVVVDFAGLKIPSQRVPVRLQHDPRAGLGHTVRIAKEAGQAGNQLIAEGLISRETEEAREVVGSSKRGFPWQASVGLRVSNKERVLAGSAVKVNGRTFDGPVYVARKSILGEISLVDRGGDPNTAVDITAQHGEGERMAEKDGGAPDKAALEAAAGAKRIGDEKAKAAEAKKVADALVAQGKAADLEASQAVENLRAVTAAEVERLAAIAKTCDGKHAEIEAKAIREGWPAMQCELEVLRASRPKAPAGHVTDTSLTGDVLEAACALSGGLADVEQHYDEKTLDAASKRFKRGIGLQELLLEAAVARGYTGRSSRDLLAIQRAAFHGDLQAAFSTIDVAGILANVANKFLLAGFFGTEQTWRNISSRRNVPDFKQCTSYRLTGGGAYQEVGPSGEIQHGTLSEESYTNQAKTYGLMLSATRVDMVNDDLGAFTSVPKILGRGSGAALNHAFWTLFMNNSAVFTTARGNLQEGAATALSINSLTAAEILFMSLEDADGLPIGVEPRILLVPIALGATASTLMKAAELRDTTASTKYPVTNPHAGKFTVEVSRYLSKAAYTGYSALKWYMLASPQDLPTIEVAFLNGQEAPTVESAEAEFNVLGIQLRGYHDFGVAVQDYRGGVASKGEA